MRLLGSRGTPENPGLMAALDKGGFCEGVAFRIAAELVDRETERLWMREMFSGSYCPRFVRVSTPQGDIEALTFLIDPESDRYVPDLSLTETAEVIARASGHNGTNYDYLGSLCEHLLELGLSDRHMAELYDLASKAKDRKPV